MTTAATPAIDYTARDFLTIKEALKEHLKAKFPTTWRDFYESSAGIAILDLIAYSHDVLSFGLDYTANELYLPTARDRDSVLLLGRLVGYQLRTATSASVVCTSRIDSTYTEGIIIPAGSTIKSTGNVDFVTTEDARIEAGSVVGTVTFVQGVNVTENFSSDGSAFQKVNLTRYSVVQGTVSVLVDGDEWTEETSLAYAGANSNAFSVEYAEDGVATVVFGDGTSGRVPPVGSNIEVTYRTGGGLSGNIALNEISGTVQGYRELVSPTAWVTVNILNDAQRGAGGEEAESVSHAKLWIPPWIRANGRAVTETDYDALANAFSDSTYGAPAFAKSKLKQEIPELNTVELYVWARDSGGDIVTPSQGLKDALDTYFNNNGTGSVKCICTHTEVVDGLIVYIDVSIAIRVATSYVSAGVITEVQTTIESLFDSSEVAPGQDFRLSALYEAVHSLAGVDYCLVRSLVASYITTEIVGVGDDTDVTFTSTLDLDPGLEVVPHTVRMYYGAETEVLTDDGEGNLLDSIQTVKGSIDYETGSITGIFASAPASGASVYAEYRHKLDYARGEVEDTGDGTTTIFEGAVTYPPVNPYDPTTGQKGIAFSDGNQVILDDGDGNLVDDPTDPLSSNRGLIDYGTGGYTLRFPNPPPNNAEIRSTYMQILETDSQDIPIEKSQIAVKGLITISTL